MLTSLQKGKNNKNNEIEPTEDYLSIEKSNCLTFINFSNKTGFYLKWHHKRHYKICLTDPLTASYRVLVDFDSNDSHHISWVKKHYKGECQLTCKTETRVMTDPVSIICWRRSWRHFQNLQKYIISTTIGNENQLPHSQKKKLQQALCVCFKPIKYKHSHVYHTRLLAAYTERDVPIMTLDWIKPSLAINVWSPSAKFKWSIAMACVS